MDNKKEFIDLCKKGDEQALTLLYKTYSGKMMRICLRYVSDKQIAQDLLHDGFIIIFTSIETLRHPEKIESWMGMIMKNISLRYLKQHSTLNTISLLEVEEWEEPVDTQLSGSFPSYTTMINMIEKLPDGYRKVFKLAVLEGLSHKEIGSLLGIAPHSSSSQLFRAKEMLRKFIVEYSIITALLLLLVSPFGIWLSIKRGTTKESRETELKEKTNNQETETLINDSINSTLPLIQDIPYAQSKSISDTVQHKSVAQDSITKLIHIKDTVSIANNTPAKGKKHKQQYNTDIYYSPNKKRNWSLGLAYSGGEDQTMTKHSIIPGCETSGEPKEVKEKVHQYMPITLSFSLYKKINDYWGIETGIRYTHLRTDFTSISEPYSERIQKIDYLGIPIKGVVQIWKHRNMSIYTSAGVAVDIPIKTKSEEAHMENGQLTEMKKQDLNVPLQWSLDFGAGLQYHITPSVGIYVEPNLRYYLNNATQLNTISKEHPVDISLPIGIRFSW